MVLLVAASLVSAACVSVAGIIGFVGLLVPHLMRMLVGPDNRVLLPASALAGAALLLGADTITRAVLPHEVPIGVLGDHHRRALLLLRVPPPRAGRRQWLNRCWTYAV